MRASSNHRPNGALRVATISKTDTVQLYDCRIALEQLSVTGACQNATESQPLRTHRGASGEASEQ